MPPFPFQSDSFPPLSGNNFLWPLKRSQFNEIDLFCGMHPILTPRSQLIIKHTPDDFIVQEISPSGSKIPLKPS